MRQGKYQYKIFNDENIQNSKTDISNFANTRKEKRENIQDMIKIKNGILV